MEEVIWPHCTLKSLSKFFPSEFQKPGRTYQKLLALIKDSEEFCRTVLPSAAGSAWKRCTSGLSWASTFFTCRPTGSAAEQTVGGVVVLHVGLLTDAVAALCWRCWGPK